MEKEKNPYMISIVGEQKVEGQDDRIEVITEGKYMMKNGHFLINYKDMTKICPISFSTTWLRLKTKPLRFHAKDR